MTEKPAKPAETATALRKRTPAPRKPSQGDIAERAYFIDLEEGRWDGLGHWLRAERGLTAA